jgi:hypothetical protein
MMPKEHRPDDLELMNDLADADPRSDGNTLQPFEAPTADVDWDTRADALPLARRFRSQAHRYLLQLRCDLPSGEHGNDVHQTALAAVANSIWVLGGVLEQQWKTPGEFDLILVMRLQSNQINIASVEMALTAMPMVKSLRITPLQALDTPADGASTEVAAGRKRGGIDYDVIAGVFASLNLEDA